MTPAPAALLQAHALWRRRQGGRRLVWSDLDEVRRTSLREADLRFVDLGGADLDMAELAGLDLSNASLRGARLRSARLDGARLVEADFEGADLYGAEMAGADLQRATLRGASLHQAGFRRARLNGADMSGADLTGADFGLAELERARWTQGLGAVQGPTRSDGLAFTLFASPLGDRVHAGGETEDSIADWQAGLAWRATREPAALVAETARILDYLAGARDALRLEWLGAG